MPQPPYPPQPPQPSQPPQDASGSQGSAGRRASRPTASPNASPSASSAASPAGSSTGSPAHTAEWIGRHQAYVWRYLRYLGASAGLAEDLAQETFLAALHHGIAEQDAATGLAWLRTTSRNLFFMYLRRQKRHREVTGLLELDPAYELETHPDLGEGYLSALRQCLQSLDQRGRDVLRLRYQEERSRTEMASAMSLSEEGVKTLLRRVKEQLRTCIEKRRQS